MSGCHKHIVDDDDDENEEEGDEVYIYPIYMNPDNRADYRAACCAFKASELNQQREEGFIRGTRKISKSFNLNSLL